MAWSCHATSGGLLMLNDCNGHSWRLLSSVLLMLSQKHLMLMFRIGLVSLPHTQLLSKCSWLLDSM